MRGPAGRSLFLPQRRGGGPHATAASTVHARLRCFKTAKTSVLAGGFTGVAFLSHTFFKKWVTFRTVFFLNFGVWLLEAHCGGEWLCIASGGSLPQNVPRE